MEDPELLAADCVVICTCCPCLVLQVLLFLLIRLPCKLAKRSKRLVLRRLRKRPRRGRRRREVAATEMIVFREDPFDGFVQMGIADAVPGRGCRGGRRVCAIAEAQRVLEQLYEEGELGFGGFRRRSECGGGSGGGEPLGAGFPRHCHLVVRGGGGGDGDGGRRDDLRCVQVLYM
ncbi:hypothetical protein Taro_003202 [Colocasia esculenta]|uniref:Uncharacterized protein n=1 Tax=Colocasia esculenta TaxID=4460 RepID=A0A843TNE9_COLES|nr:hypothetical protein [Colocasia esculenta]